MIEIKTNLIQQDNSPAVSVDIAGDMSQGTENERRMALLVVAGFKLAMQVAGATVEVPLTCLDKDGKSIFVEEGPSSDGPVNVNTQPVEA